MLITPYDAKKAFPNYAGDPMLMAKDPVFEIYWVPDTFCNYKCSYCWPGANSPIRHHLPPEVLRQALIDLKEKINELGIYNIHLSFAGGEPTLLPGFLELVELFANDTNQKRQWLGMSTNLTQGKRWWSKFLQATDKLYSLSISASWHNESVGDVQEARQRFVEVSNLINSYQNGSRWCGITMVMPPEQFEKCYDDALFFRENGLHCLLRVERRTIQGKMLQAPGYTDDMIDKIVNWKPRLSKASTETFDHGFVHKENGEAIKYGDVEHAIALGKTDYLKWRCFGGVTSVVIYPNGNILRGHACRDKKIGNITDNSYKLHSYPQECITVKCGCSADMRLVKVKL